MRNLKEKRCNFKGVSCQIEDILGNILVEDIAQVKENEQMDMKKRRRKFY